MKFNAKLLALYLVLFCLSCGAGPATTDQEEVNLFFDLDAYFSQQIIELEAKQPKLLKKVRINEQEEEKEIRQADFAKELQIFRRSDINRPAWSDKYQADSTFAGGQLLAVQYIALDTTLNTRLVEVNFKEGTVERIQIQNRSHSVIAESAQDLLYLPGKSYYIESRQKTIGSELKRIEVEVEIR